MTLGFGIDPLRDFVRDAVKVRLARHPRLAPIMLAYFVTFRCNLHCAYCEYADSDYASTYPEATTSQAKDILRICRGGAPAIAFSGGEPLVRDDIVELAALARALRYRPVSLFTNSLLLAEREKILDYVDFLQVSLDTLDEEKQDTMNGRKNVGRTVKANIQRYARLQSEKDFRMNINCVVSPENVDDIPGLVDFAARNRVRFSLCPQLDQNHMPQKGLMTEGYAAKYRRTIDRMLRSRSARRVALDIKPFLQHIKSFERYRCYPSLTPRVYPDGSFIFPCPNLCRDRLNVLREASWHKLMEVVRDRDWACETPCFLPCYLETSLLVRHPFALLREL